MILSQRTDERKPFEKLICDEIYLRSYIWANNNYLIIGILYNQIKFTKTHNNVVKAWYIIKGLHAASLKANIAQYPK